MCRSTLRRLLVCALASLAPVLALRAQTSEPTRAGQPPRLQAAPAAPVPAVTAPAPAPGDAASVPPAGKPWGDGSDGPPKAAFALPTGFVDELVLGNWNQADGVTFDHTGRAFVWERSGKVWVVENGVKSAAPMLDISEEVGAWEDYGLIGFALDPDFLSNGFIYLFYVVDHHYLTKFGTPEYSATTNEYYKDTIARLTRYTADAEDGFHGVDRGSRLVLLGESVGTGIPITGLTHGPGTVLFGEDGTLIVSAGEGSDGKSSGTALAEGIIKPKENVGNWRAQLVDSLSGKILRLDPATGDGVPSNPFYDPAAPRAARSRVWAVGVRQPFRMSLRPGTGHNNAGHGDPGTLLFGDVGAETWEELNVVRLGGQNFGWPKWEGLHPGATTANPQNFDAPNPLAGQNGCSPPFFTFKSLVVDDALTPPFWSNPCDPGTPIVAPVPLFVHTRPVLEWKHDAPVANVPTYDAGGVAAIAQLGAPDAPVAGPTFRGNCSVGGCWYPSGSFPAMYEGTYFHGDFGQGWIQNLVFDQDDHLLEVRPFAQAVGRPVCVAYDAAEDSIWYINYTDFGTSELRHIHFATSNVAPHAVVHAAPAYGATPLSVAFDATASSDPDGDALAYRWDFGDGTPPSHQAKPVHVFPSSDITAEGTFIGVVFDLVPSGSSGFSNHDPEVMRDGDLPPLNTTDKQREYDTLHVNLHGFNDKPAIDWIGYSFPSARVFHGLLFQEGMTFQGGGAFESVAVEVRQFGNWVEVPGVTFSPAYPGEYFPHYETFEISFPPILANAIRLRGPPDGIGTLKFVTIGELRVIGVDPDAPAPAANVNVTLTVTDPAGASSAASTVVTLNDTPPTAGIVQPANYATYSPTDPAIMTLTGAAADAEQPVEQLACTWQVNHHHNEHVHPGDPMPGCEISTTVSTEGCTGETHWLEIVYTVTDPFGLSGSASINLVPECDLDMNGIEDALEIASGAAADLNRNGIPDVAENDCNANGTPDVYEVFFEGAADINGNRIPDECESFTRPTQAPPLQH